MSTPPLLTHIMPAAVAAMCCCAVPPCCSVALGYVCCAHLLGWQCCATSCTDGWPLPGWLQCRLLHCMVLHAVHAWLLVPCAAHILADGCAHLLTGCFLALTETKWHPVMLLCALLAGWCQALSCTLCICETTCLLECAPACWVVLVP